jgi:formylglycine-generating enzyme required for sulfatase activity
MAGTMDAASSATPAGTFGTQVLTVEVGDVPLELVCIPAGGFRMGSASGPRDARPVHEVRIGYDFHLGRTEVTVRQFRAFVAATGYRTDAERAGWANTCPLPGVHGHQRGLDWRRPGFVLQEDQPVVTVSRNDALAFCRWLSERTGRSVRLPTEAEWEYAARAGCREDTTDRLGEASWSKENAADAAHPVGTKAANAWGLHDMQGNAWEWCLDVWNPDYREASMDGCARMHDPAVPQAAWRYVLRGGSWAGPAPQLSFSYRERRIQSFCRPDIGFRIVVPATETGEKMPAAVAAGGADVRRPVHGACTRDGETGRAVLTVHGTRFEFVRIPAGPFLMGCTGEIEKPAHPVRIGYDFEMGPTEVTVGQFRAFIRATGYLTDGEKEGYGWLRRGEEDWQSEDGVDWYHATSDQSDDHPAVFISWYDAMAFCHWLSIESGQEIRLPSEAEWEHACRAGTTGLYAGELSAMGWYQYNSCNRAHAVAQKQPNAWGLYDMHGNVWEWCLDFFATSYEGAPTDGRPRWDAAGAVDVISRGGSFVNPPGWLASGCRMGTPPSASHYNNGFRLVRGVKKSGPGKAVAGESKPAQLAPVETEIPRPIFIGTPRDIRVARVKPVQTMAGPAFLAPVGTKNVALGKPVSASDEEPVIGELALITDGDKEAVAGSFVELGPLLQHVTVDLQGAYEIHGIRVWHYHEQPRVYFDVVIQVAGDADFVQDVRTIFNNDMDNSAGLGTGKDLHYVDTHFGELFDARATRGRYVRLYSRGNSSDDQNHYIEVEVYGRPAAP